MTWQFLSTPAPRNGFGQFIVLTAEIRLIAAQRKPQIPARYALFAEQIKRQPALPAKTGISPPPTAEYKQN